MNKDEFDLHIKNEHQSSPLATYIEECIYGGNDGIVTTFAVVAGFSGASLGDHTLNISIISVLLFGLANLIADGAAMGLGNYLSIKTSSNVQLRDNINKYDYRKYSNYHFILEKFKKDYGWLSKEN